MDNILIVDDDKNLCLLLSEELQAIGYNADYVTSANDVFNYLESGKIINLILLDLKMPEKDGFYVLRKLKNENYNIAVIVLTAYADVKSAIESAGSVLAILLVNLMIWTI